MPDPVDESRSEKKTKGYLDQIGYDPDKHLTRTVTGGPGDTRSDRADKAPAGAVKKDRRRTALVAIGIILIAASTVFAFMSLKDSGSETIADTVEYNMFQDVLASTELDYADGPGRGCFNAGSIMSIQGDELKTDIAASDEQYLDYEFSINIIDISDYPVKYTRSDSAGNAITTAEPPNGDGGDRVRTFETAVNIFVDDDEVHTARFIMEIWKA